jgi:endo-1,4-beta-xylanase
MFFAWASISGFAFCVEKNNDNQTNLTIENSHLFPIGVAVAAGQDKDSILNDNRQKFVVAKYFSQITPANIMKMKYLHPEKNIYAFEEADHLIDWAHKNNITVHAHALVWHSDYQVPDWMKIYPGDKAAWISMLKTHVFTVAAHFAGRVRSWDVVNEVLEDGGGYRNSIFYQKTGTDYIDQAFLSAREADGTAELYYNDYNIEQDAKKLVSLTNMLDGMISRKIPISGVGFQMHIWMDYPSISTLKDSMQKVVDRKLKVKITELDIPINNLYSEDYKSGKIYRTLTPDLALKQQQRYCEVVRAYLETVPIELRGGVSVWGVRDNESWLNGYLFKNENITFPLLFNEKYEPKLAMQGFVKGLQLQPCGG